MLGRLSILFALVLALLMAPAAKGQQLFSDFPVNGQISAFQVNGGYSTSNSFTLASGGTIGEAVFGAWVSSGDSVKGITWSIGTTPFDTSLGTGVAGATSAYDSTNVDGFDVNTVTFAIPSITLPAGTYYLTISNAVSASGNPVYWDINNAAGVDAWDSTYGHVSAANACYATIGISGTCASSFQLEGTSTALTALPPSVSFANQTVNTTSTAQPVTITNTGSGAATIAGIAITGTNPSDFAQTNNCPLSPATLAASGTCTINVTFTPQAANPLTAAITLTGTSPLSIPLSGTGTQVPSTVTLLPTSITFPNQALSTTSGTNGITVTNSGPSPLTISSIAITGTNTGDFAQSNNCPLSPATVAVSGTCTINVAFTPQAIGTRSAVVTITDNGNSSPQSVGLSGTGVSVPTWPNGYAYQATFTVAAGQVPSAQTNFPALISGTYADFATTANGGRINNTCTQVVGNNSTAVPCDLIFTSDAAGTQILSWEFETWNAATGAANIWVNVPNLANGTVIYAWYGQSSVTTLETTPLATWTNYMAVYHMKENPAGAAPQLNDSTGNGNNATMNGSVLASQQQPGEIDGSINFEGTTWASLSSSSAFSFERTDSFSLSGWFEIGSNATGTLISKIPAIPNAGWTLVQFNGASSPHIALGLLGTNSSTGALAETPQVSMGVWHYVVATYSGTGNTAGMNIYVDGVQQTLTSLLNNLSTSILNNVTPAISSRSTAFQVSNDSMDELRVSNKGVVLSPAWVTASYNNENSPATFFGVATGLTNQSAGPVASLTAALSFPNTLTGTTSAALAATLSNTGTAPLNNIVPSIAGTNPSDFAPTTGANACGATLASGSSCSIYVTFTPASAASFSAALSVADSASGSPQTAVLSGTGTAPAASLSPALSFPNTLTGTTSAALAATLSNTGTAPLNNIVPTIAGTNPSDFAPTTGANACGATLASGSSCSIYVTFTPASAASFSATLSVADSASGSPQTAVLSGTGTAPAASLSPALSFPSTPTGTTSAALAATLSNTGTAPLNNIVPSIVGANLGDFALTTGANACGSTLAAGSSCSIYVTFTPASATSFSATLSVADSASGSPQTAVLSGTGTAPAASLSPALSFPNTLTGTTSAALAATLSNTGTAPLNNIVPSIVGTNPSDFAPTTGANACGATLAAGSSCSIYVTFTPASAASFSATLSVADSASGSPQTVSLGGTGVTSGPTTWPNGYTYQATFTVAAGQVPSAQSNFPALISGTWADFATTANGGRINNTCAQVVGNNSISVPCDLIFTSDAAGTQILSWEFETWNAATGAANIWVNVPNLANGTVIYAWYGQSSVTTLETTPSAMWTNYMAVYHLKENPAGTAPQLNDSTSNANNATMNGSALASQQQPGKIDGSINFEGDTWASLSSPSAFSFERTDSFSLSGWFKIGSNATGTLISKTPAVANAGWTLVQFTGASSPDIALGLLGTNASTGALAETPQLSMGVWHYVVATYAGTGSTAGMNIYVDGVNQPLTVLINNLATSILNNVTPAISSRSTAFQVSNDSMDELRVSNKGVVLSPAWVTASYNNEKSPGTFFTVITGLTNP
jgi:hypothetical protein